MSEVGNFSLGFRLWMIRSEPDLVPEGLQGFKRAEVAVLVVVSTTHPAYPPTCLLYAVIANAYTDSRDPKPSAQNLQASKNPPRVPASCQGQCQRLIAASAEGAFLRVRALLRRFFGLITS